MSAPRVSAYERNRLNMAFDRMRRERLTGEQERVLRLISSGQLQVADGQDEGFVFVAGVKPATLRRLESLGRIELKIRIDEVNVYRGHMFGRNGGTRTYNVRTYLARRKPEPRKGGR